MDKINTIGQKHLDILQNIAEGGALSNSLDMLCHHTESFDPTLRCSVLLYDAKTNQLFHGGAPSLPDFYCQAIDGLEAGDGVGSCGTAAFTGTQVIVENIETHPYWQPFLELTQKAGLKACWSQPIFSKTHEVIGTFAMYYDEVRHPTESDIKLIEEQANIASIAIESELKDRLLQETNLRLDSLIQSLPDVISRYTNDGIITFANQACAEFLGQSINDIIGKSVYDFIPEEDYPRVKAEHDKLSAQTPIIEIENLVQIPNGDLRLFEWRNQAHLDDDGEIYEIQSSGRDITERRKAEKELIAARVEADKSNKAKSQFLANMSHELRTPLNAIIGFSEILTDGNYDIFGHEKRREYAHDIGESGRFLLGLINDILDTAKIEADKLVLKKEAIDFSELVDRCYKMISVQAVGLGLTLEKALPADLPLLIADKTRTQQMLANLYSNALKFTDSGGTVTTKAGLDTKGRIYVTVSDTGIGIAEKDIELVFSKFGQVNTSYARNHDGTGLGLSLVKLLIEAHEGTVVLESELGKGTTITLTFPTSSIMT